MQKLYGVVIVIILGCGGESLNDLSILGATSAQCDGEYCQAVWTETLEDPPRALVCSTEECLCYREMDITICEITIERLSLSGLYDVWESG